MKRRSTLGTIKTGMLREEIEQTAALGPTIRSLAPTADYVTEYDQELMLTYIILSHECDTAPWEWLARKYLRITPEVGAEKARACYESHLARAKWFVTEGQRLYIEQGPRPE